MTPERRPCTGCSPPAPVRGCREFAAWVVSLCFCLLSSLPVVLAAEPPAIGAGADLRHELLARQALLNDRVLAPLNLGVRVHKHVAVLWGPVPSADLGRRAVEVLKQLPELIEVQNELHVRPPEEAPPDVPPLPPPLRPLPLQDGPRPPAPSTGILTRHSTPLPQASPAPVEPPPWTPPDQAAFAPRQNAGPLLPFIDIPRPSTAATAASDQGEWLIEAVTRVQRSNPRFRQLRPEVRGRTVRLDGTVQRWDDAQELARRLTHLPGVEHVVLGDIRTASASP